MIVELHVVFDGECTSCPEGMPVQECAKSKRVCGHHCNCSWDQDRCCWCGVEFHGDGLEVWPGGIEVQR